MAVHDDGDYTGGVLKPGHVFSIDPQLRVPEEHIYLRYEDVIVITEKGYENFTDFLPTRARRHRKTCRSRRDAPIVPGDVGVEGERCVATLSLEYMRLVSPEHCSSEHDASAHFW